MMSDRRYDKVIVAGRPSSPRRRRRVSRVPVSEWVAETPSSGSEPRAQMAAGPSDVAPP
jgi:hypothetical protein